ncbi:MAG: hypothetical protein GQE15_07865 [Archangiaceae bacterium]|nr:hypothetical protein [Archangiaceae bacterium]
MSAHSPGDPRLAELQSWLDAAEAENETLKAKVAELEKSPPAKIGGNSELQQWLDAAEAENEKLKAKLAELEKAPPAKSGGNSELQQWLDAAEAENEKLKEKLAQLEKAPPAKSGGNSELQQWLDAAAAENEKLKEKLAELEKSPPAKSGGNSELQQWLDAAEAENEKLKEQLAQLEKGGGGGGNASELEQKLHESEEHAEALRREVAELKCIVAAEESELKELQLHAPAQHAHADDAKTAELQSWLDAAEKENEALRAKLEAGGGGSGGGDEALQQRLAEAEAQNEALKREVVELKCVVAAEESELNELHLHQGAPTHAPAAGGDARAAELQSWLDAAEQENVRLRAELAKSKPETVGTGSAEEEYLRERLSEVEAALHSMKGLNARFAEQIETSSKRDIERLKVELAAAKSKGDPTKLHQLEEALELAQESVATLTAERTAAIEQVRRYVGSDESSEGDKKHAAELAKKDKRITDLEAEVMGQAEDLHGFRQRINAWETRDAEMQQQIDDLRKRACDAEAKAAETQGTLERTEAREAEKDARLAELERKNGENDRWLAQAELDNAALQKDLDALRLEKALTGRPAEPGTTQPRSDQEPPIPPARAVVEGFDESAMIRVLKLERQLEAEREAASALRRFADVSERALAKAKDELELAHARLKDLKHRLGDSDAEAGEALDRLYGTQKELDALRAELSRALHDSAGVPESADDAIVEEHEVKAAVAGPLSAMEQLGEDQAKAAKEATDALLAEQKARDALLGDLNWLKAEVEKLSNVREDLRHRIAAMVKRELDRKAQLARLLAKLRENEVTSATRLSAVRRLQAAVELSQRMAVKVQTVYFQKQIGSLAKQLEKEKKAKLSVVKKPAA